MIEASVIIPFFGEVGSLRTCLTALAAQTHPAEAFEVIVIDNGSPEDPTVLQKEFPRVRWLKEPRVGSYAARNCGVAQAAGRVLAFTDADCVPDPTWLSEGLRALVAANAGLIGGRVTYLDPVGRRLNLYEMIEEKYFLLGKQQHLIEKMGVAATANLLTYREVFDRVGPFDSALKSFGDGDWTKRAIAKGESLRYAGSMLVRHPRRDNYGAIKRKLVRVAGGRMSLMLRNREPAWRFAANLLSYSILDPRLYFSPWTFQGVNLVQRGKLFVMLVLLSLQIDWAKLRVILGGEAERG